MNNTTTINKVISKRGFTLIELLIVIGILAILSTTVVLVLNPAEILKEARDGQRLNDLRTVSSAINLYLARVSNPTLAGLTCIAGSVKTPRWKISINNYPDTDPDYYQQPFIFSSDTNGAQRPANLTNVRSVIGAGWVSVDFTQIYAGTAAPFAKLPVDPINSVPNVYSGLPCHDDICVPAYFYAYQCQGLTYELNANMESDKFSNGGVKDVESTDGGTNARYLDYCDQGCPNTIEVANYIYEIGNDPGLDL